MHVQLDPILVVQHGVVTRHQCWLAGLSPHQVQTLLASGRLVATHRGVYRDPAAPVTLDQRALAGVLACGPGAVASHRLAVALWGMKNYQCRLIEVTAPGLRRVPNAFTHRSLRPPEQTVLRGVPVTSAARTALDVAAVVSRGVLAIWLQTWLSSKVVSIDDIESQIAMVRGHHGTPNLRAALTDRTILFARTDSEPEARLGLLLERSGLPTLTLHHLVTVPSGAEFELDWSYPQWRIAFEMDGYGVHLRSLETFEHDRYRRNELVIDGWTILNFTTRQVDRKARTVVDQVRRLLVKRRVFDFPPLS